MATTLPMATPTRQPFGVLDQSKVRMLQSVKNRQNGITPSSAPTLKRRAASPENSDSENVDPNLFDSLSKRKRSSFEDDVSSSKPSRLYINSVTTSKPQTLLSTPRIDTFQPTAPISAPPAAGRSPTKPKKHGLLASKKRFAPPSFNTKSPALTFTAALNGTLAHKKSKKIRTIQESKPRSWFFDIHEETEQHQNDRMNEWTISQSAIGLDISDDETKSKEKNDRGKENIDPNEITAPVTRSMAAAKAATVELRKDIMTDDTRAPLNDLNPADFYAEGLDATSVVLVQDVTPEESRPDIVEENAASLPSAQDFNFSHATAPETTNDLTTTDLTTTDIGAVILSAAPNWETETLVSETDKLEENLDIPQQEDIEIWESESAKDENEKPVLDLEGCGETVLALQEL